MGTKPGVRIKAALDFRCFGANSPIAQVIHPCWIHRDMDKIANLFPIIDSELPSEVKLVLCGGGLIEIETSLENTYREFRSEEALRRLLSIVKSKIASFMDVIADTHRDYVIGIDILNSSRERKHKGVGQFAVFISDANIEEIIWKSYPVLDESQWLAGFGTKMGRNSKRVMNTKLGNTMILICHDAQAYNHRNRALVRRAEEPTDRRKAMDAMDQILFTDQPDWVLNLVHYFDKPGSVKPFATSYKQIHHDNDWHPKVIGSFGYDKSVRPEICSLAEKMRYPKTVSCVLGVIDTVE